MQMILGSVFFTGILTNLAWGTIADPFGNDAFKYNEQFVEDDRRKDFSEKASDLELNSDQQSDLAAFYTENEFATNLYAEIRSTTILADAEITTHGLKKIFPDKCDALIDQIATAVRGEISDVLLDGARDIKQACPQWHRLREGDRKDFYVALVTSMALAESSCNNRVRNRNAADGTGYGLWQSRRPLSPVQGARWTIHQIESQIERSGLLFWSNSNLNYWAVLNPTIHAHKVKRILKKIPACVINAATQH